MRSIPTIFVWDKDIRTVINKPLRMVDWVLQGKGVATRKWDGIAIKVENGKVYRRHEWRSGEPVPNGFAKVQDPDPKRPQAAIPGWIPVGESFKTNPQGPDEKALKEAWDDKLKQLTQVLWCRLDAAEAAHKKALEEVGKEEIGPMSLVPVPDKYIHITVVPNGTYELCGPKIRGNHEELASHVMYKHGESVLKGVPRTYDGLKKFLESFEGEGIVWHYQMKGDVTPMMAKIKRRDFGFHTRLTKDEISMAYGESSKKQASDKAEAEFREKLEKVEEEAEAESATV